MSTIPERLQSSKDGLEALLTYANGVTGQTDSNIGDAVKTLCDGFGGGGTESISGTASITNANTQKFITYGAEYKDYIAIWEYTATDQFVETGENKHLSIDGICVHLGSTGYDIVISRQLNPSIMSYSMYGIYAAPGTTIMSGGLPSDYAFRWHTWYSLPTGFGSIPNNIAYTVYKINLEE